MTQPTWIRCSEQMPPYEDIPIIVKDGDRIYIVGAKIVGDYPDFDELWMPYTKETWRELNGK